MAHPPVRGGRARLPVPGGVRRVPGAGRARLRIEFRSTCPQRQAAPTGIAHGCAGSPDQPHGAGKHARAAAARELARRGAARGRPPRPRDRAGPGVRGRGGAAAPQARTRHARQAGGHLPVRRAAGHRQDLPRQDPGQEPRAAAAAFRHDADELAARGHPAVRLAQGLCGLGHVRQADRRAEGETRRAGAARRDRESPSRRVQEVPVRLERRAHHGGLERAAGVDVAGDLHPDLQHRHRDAERDRRAARRRPGPDAGRVGRGAAPGGVRARGAEPARPDLRVPLAARARRGARGPHSRSRR